MKSLKWKSSNGKKNQCLCGAVLHFSTWDFSGAQFCVYFHRHLPERTMREKRSPTSKVEECNVLGCLVVRSTIFGVPGCWRTWLWITSIGPPDCPLARTRHPSAQKGSTWSGKCGKCVIITWLLGARMFGRYSNVRRVGNLGVFIFSSALVLSSITGNHRMNDELGSFSVGWRKEK